MFLRRSLTSLSRPLHSVRPLIVLRPFTKENSTKDPQIKDSLRETAKENHGFVTTRCSVLGSAQRFDLASILENPPLSKYKPTLVDEETVYVSNVFRSDEDNTRLRSDLFIFKHGYFVSWGFTEPEERRLATSLGHFAKGQIVDFEQVPVDEYEFKIGEKAGLDGNTILVDQNAIVRVPEPPKEEVNTEGLDNLAFQKLAISSALGQSIKLRQFEEEMDSVYTLVEKMLAELEEKGKISLTKTQTTKLMARLMRTKSNVNLHTDLIEDPQFLWELSDLSPYYERVRKYVDLKERIRILNTRVDLIRDVYTMLGDEHNHKHSARLEIIIIWLIATEIVLSIVHHSF